MKVATTIAETRWVLDETRRKAARFELDRILATPGLSRDVFEIVSRIAQG